MNLSHRMTDTVTVAAQSTVDTNGDPTFASQTTIAARVQNGRDRNETSIDHDAVVYTYTLVNVDDRLWLPGDNTADTNAARRALKVTWSSAPTGGPTLYKILV